MIHLLEPVKGRDKHLDDMANYWRFVKMLFPRLLIIFVLAGVAFSFLDIEEIRELKYGIEISQVPVLFSEPGASNVLHVSSKFGQLYQCTVPMRKVREDPLLKRNKKETLTSAEVLKALENALADLCIVYMKDWWTYRLCFKKKIEQYHKASSGDITGDIISLGTFQSETDWDKRKEEKGKEVLYHQHIYTNGSTCDLTGKPRESKVKFYCDESALTGTILRIDEPESCSYEMKVATSALCEIPWFKPIKNNNKKDIMCSPALHQKQYDDYLVKEEEKKQKEREKRKKDMENSLLLGSNLDDLAAFGKIFDLKKTDSRASLLYDGTERKGKEKEEKKEDGKGTDTIKSDSEITGPEKDLSPEALFANAMKGLMSAFNIKPEEMKMVSIDKDGNKITFKSIEEDDDEISPGTSIATERMEKDKKAKEDKVIESSSSEPDAFVTAFLKGIAQGAKTLSKEADGGIFRDTKDDSGETLAGESSNDAKPDENDAVLKGIEKQGSPRITEREVKLEYTSTDEKDANLEEKEGGVSGTTEDDARGSDNGGTGDLKEGKVGNRKEIYVGNIKELLKKARNHYTTLLDEKDELGDRIARTYASTREKVNRHLDHLEETVRAIKKKELQIKEKNREETAENMVRKLRESMSTYRRKLQNLERKMQDVRNLARKNRDNYRELLGEPNTDENHDNSDDVFLKALDRLKNGVVTALETVEEDEKQADLLNAKGEEEGQAKVEKGQIERKGKESLNDALERLGTMIREKMENNDDSETAGEQQQDNDLVRSSTSKKEGIKFRVRRLSKEAMDKLLNEDETTESHEDAAEPSSSLSSDAAIGKAKLKQATKKMEEMIRKKLRDSGIDIDGNVKVKIITERKRFDKEDSSEDGTHYLSDGDASQFTSLLGGLLGGHHEQMEEEKRQTNLENSYHFVWGEDESKEESSRDKDESSNSWPFL